MSNLLNLDSGEEDIEGWLRNLGLKRARTSAAVKYQAWSQKEELPPNLTRWQVDLGEKRRVILERFLGVY